MNPQRNKLMNQQQILHDNTVDILEHSGKLDAYSDNQVNCLPKLSHRNFPFLHVGKVGGVVLLLKPPSKFSKNILKNSLVRS